VKLIPVMVNGLPGPDEAAPDRLYVTMDLKYTLHRCPCPCGRVVCLPIGPGGWVMSQNEAGVSLSPSILNHPCEAHYFIRDGEIVWADGRRST
jgi:hypothetical protein